jgi:NDP-sugar pyrophosphorylase family protein
MFSKLIKKIKAIQKWRPLYALRGYKISHSANIRNASMQGNNKICNGADISNSVIGKYTYLGQDSLFYRSKIGSFCSISAFAKIITGIHPINYCSTSPVFYSDDLMENRLSKLNHQSFKTISCSSGGGGIPRYYRK